MKRFKAIIDGMDTAFLGIMVSIIIIFNVVFLMLGRVEILEIIVPLVIIGLLLYVVTKYTISEKMFILILFLAALCIRGAYAYAINPLPISDFKYLLKAAHMIIDGDYSYNDGQYFSDWAYQLGFVSYQAIILKLTGNSFLILKLLNCLYMAITTVLVYLIAKSIFSEKVGKIAGILHLTYLPLIYYGSVYTNQHIATLFYYLFIWLILKNRELTYRNAILAGIALAFGQIFRPLAIVFILALILYVLYDFSKKNVKRLMPYGIMLIIFVVLFQLASLLITVTGIGENGLTNNNPYWKFVPGLNQEYYGRYNEADNELIEDLESQEQVIEIEKELILERLTVSPISMIKFQILKVGGFWSDYENSIFGLNSYEDNRYSIYFKWYTFEEIFDHFKHMEKVIYTMFFVGLFYTLKSQKSLDIRSKYLLYLLSFYMGIHLFIEVSVRYRYVMMGTIIILGAKGINDMIELSKRKEV